MIEQEQAGPCQRKAVSTIRTCLPTIRIVEWSYARQNKAYTTFSFGASRPFEPYGAPPAVNGDVSLASAV